MPQEYDIKDNLYPQETQWALVVSSMGSNSGFQKSSISKITYDNR